MGKNTCKYFEECFWLIKYILIIYNKHNFQISNSKKLWFHYQAQHVMHKRREQKIMMNINEHSNIKKQAQNTKHQAYVF